MTDIAKLREENERRSAESRAEIQQRSASDDGVLYTQPMDTSEPGQEFTDHQWHWIMMSHAEQIVDGKLRLHEESIAAPAQARLVEDLEREFDAVVSQLDTLKTEIAALRADLSVVQGIQRGQVTELVRKDASATDAA
jgi:hypothetical protein